MARTRWLLCALALGGVVTAVSAADTKDGDKKGPNTGPPEAKAKAGKEARAVPDLYLAHSMINYGRKHKSALALITAAQMLGRIDTREGKEKPTREKAGEAAGGDKKVTEGDRDPLKLARAVLAEARRMDSSKGVADAARAVAAELAEGGRGAPGGPRKTVEVVRGRSVDVYKVTFKADETAVVAVVGDGSTDLDLFVYDEFNNLIRSDLGPTDRCLVNWVPKWTGSFTIKVVNRGTIPNKYVIGHN